MLSWALSRTGYSVDSDVSSLLTGESEGWSVMTKGRERWQLALSEAGSSAPWGGQYSIRTQQFRVAAEALQALKELALRIDPVEGGLCSRVTHLFVQCKGGVGDRPSVQDLALLWLRGRPRHPLQGARTVSWVAW